jgi:hypothetical protein
MSLLVSCLFAPLVVIAPNGQQAPAIESLIQQMGSERYREREAATKTLQKHGVPALSALRKAANDNSDAEIRLRARRLVQAIEGREIAEVKNGKLSVEGKCRRVRNVIDRGMPWDHMTEMLGEPASYTTSRKGTHGVLYATYPAYGVVIMGRLRRDGRVSSVDTCTELPRK